MTTVNAHAEIPLAPGPVAAPTNFDERKWFALLVKPRHEKAVEQILSNKGFETFLPLQTRVHRYGTQNKAYRLPLFPGYLFCRFDLEARMPVLTTPSVRRVAGSGRTPLPLDATEVESLRIAVASPYRLALHPYLEAGCKVRIVEGPLTGVLGTVLEKKDSQQVVLSITMLQRSVAVLLQGNHVSPD